MVLSGSLFGRREGRDAIRSGVPAGELSACRWPIDLASDESGWNPEVASLTECIFCKIAARQVQASIVFEDDRITAFRDINPQAPVHIVVIPNQHIASLAEMEHSHEGLVGHMVYAATVLAEREGIARSGFRLVMNAGRDGGQSVDHIHLHLLGGRKMGWPPG